MNSYRNISIITGWLVFAIAAVVYYLSAEPTGSLWDCGEFILGAYKMEVVHPPGAPLFMIVGRVFIWFAEMLTDTKAHPENIAFAVNVMSGICTAFGAMFLAWTTIILGKTALAGREGVPSAAQNLALAGAGLVAGLSMTFASSVWFSAVEGEVYAMSTFFTCLVMWSVMKWYALPNEPQHDRWLIFAVYGAALSIGVHLLSLLTFPALALFYFFKKYKNHTWVGMFAAAAVGVAFIVGVQSLVITGIPKLWKYMELMMVNGFGFPFHSGLIPTLLIVAGIFWFGFRYVHQKGSALGQMLLMSALVSVVGFSTIGVIVVRANADPPINMNRPSDPIRLLSYVNREQYGERPLLYGPHFDAQPIDNEIQERYGQVVREENGKKICRYEIVDEKLSYKYNNSDKQFFPRMSDDSQGRPEKYRAWIDKPTGTVNFFDNLKFLFRYQLGWMYWRYFAWNFIGRQNGEQGYYSWDKKSGHWESGIKFIDEARLYKMDMLPQTMKKHRAKNHYYFLPLLFGLLGVWFHFRKSREEAVGILALFIITGIGIIIYSNQPPNEPRERDYVLVGSFFTFCIWIGMGVLAIFDLLKNKTGNVAAAALGSVLALTAPVIMGTENWDDHSRAGHYGARDYAANFLNSCQPNAIIFTYGDNDTYPLWYAQEVEGIRRDVRVVNLSLIQVDWYIDLLRRKVNDSAPIKLTIPRESYRGKQRNAIFYYNPGGQDQERSLTDILRFIGENHPLSTASGRKLESYLPTKNLYIPVDSAAAIATGAFDPKDSLEMVSKIPITLPNRSYITKDEVAVLDVIVSNIWDRPVYFAVTCRPDKMFGLNDYMQLEGLSLRIVPVKSQSEQGMIQYGYGRVATDILYDNVMNKYRWGNFDTHETFIDNSYGPSLQSQRVVILRAARRMVDKGENEKAISLLERYLQAFPHFNFPYDWNTMQVLNTMIQAGGYEKAKPHLEILANETLEFLTFYESIAPKFTERDGDFGQDYALAMNCKDLLIQSVRKQGDTAFLQKLEEMFKPFQTPGTGN